MLPTVLVLVPLRPESQTTVANAFNVITALDQTALDQASPATVMKFAPC
jgi:hypothetical protein